MFRTCSEIKSKVPVAKVTTKPCLEIEQTGPENKAKNFKSATTANVFTQDWFWVLLYEGEQEH